jgi:hypothetical protein
MQDSSFPNITSFMIRFVQEESSNKEGEPVYRGLIRHIQSEKEIVFTRWQDAMSFMEQFVSIEGTSRSKKPSNQIGISKDDEIAV